MDTVTREREQRPNPRTCVGCARPDAADGLLRFVLGPGGEVAVDLGDGKFGRGAHVHAQPDCLRKACAGGFARSFKTKITADLASITQQIAEGCARRVTGLLVAARRANALAIGADATCEALDAGAPLVIVAADARAGTTLGPVQQAIAEGRAIAWASKVALGEVLGRQEVGVCAVRDARFAEHIAHTRRMSDAVVGGGRSA